MPSEIEYSYVVKDLRSVTMKGKLIVEHGEWIIRTSDGKTDVVENWLDKFADQTVTIKITAVLKPFTDDGLLLSDEQKRDAKLEE